jgi:protein TonB
VKFAVASDGSVKRIELFKGVHPLLDQEAMRVISTLPSWKPGRQNGRAVAVWFYVPVTFQLEVN